jgi:superfamily I DNA/RNA helicase
LAVPGSGKTTALQAKLYCLSKERSNSSTKGILVLSHTNAAVEEFRKKLSTVCPSLFEYPNFIGTIQNFIDSFLAIPFYNQTYAQSITRIDSAIYKEELDVKQ